MTHQNNDAQPVLTDEELKAIITDAHQSHGAFKTGYGLSLGRAIESALLSKLRAEGVQAGDEREADDTLTQVYDRFGIGVLARNPSTLMACLGNVIRRANCLSQVEQVLSVPTPPEPEDDGVWGEESLLRWGADEKGYAEHFKAALAEWSRRAALASAPVADERTAFGRAELSFPLAIPGSRVYLAGPMTGYDDHNFPAFHAAAERLRGFGLEVVNPADHGLVDGLGWADYMRWDLVKLAGCHSVYVLPGWEKSKGASLEVAIAQALGMLVFTVEGAPVKASAPVAGEAQPTDAEVMKVYAETVAEFSDGRGFEAGTVAFARAMLRRYAAPQASEAVRKPDYTLQRADHMAVTAERLMEAVNARDAVIMQRDESDDVDDEAMQEQHENVSEYLSGMREAIYEYRKRRNRAALSPTQPTEQGERDA
jgi:hypothetical protein